MLAFNFSQFKTIISRNGWVRKFYEVLKTATTQGVIDRMFISGVSPITLDSLTSGFNIATNISNDSFLNEMMGFTQLEVRQLLKDIEVPAVAIGKVMTDLQLWYDGYKFHQDGKQQVYNPDMVLYFAKHYARHRKYPDDLLDENIASDYGKMRRMFKINDTKEENNQILKEIIEKGEVTATLTKKYSFERPWTKGDFISLLFYMGILSIKGHRLGRPIFQIPNFVIKQLYFQYFNQIILESTKISPYQINLADKVTDLAEYNELQPLIDLTQNIITQLAVEDRAHFNETSLKAIFASFFYQVQYFNVFSELEVKKSSDKKGRVDLLLTGRPPFKPKYQFVFELKYLREKQRTDLEEIKKAAIKQLRDYLKNDDTLKNLDNLKAYVIIFIVNEGIVIQV